MDPSPESSFVSPGWRRRRSISGRELQANKQALTFTIWEPELRVLNSEERGGLGFRASSSGEARRQRRSPAELAGP